MNLPERVYLICTSPRSGSNLLCEFLEGTGVLGKPREYFNATGRRLFDDPEFPDEPEAQMCRALETATSAQGVFGIKVFAAQMPVALASPTFRRLLPKARYLHLRRRDLLGQAISLARAERTGSYRASQIPVRSAVYERARIEAALRRIALEHASWEQYFASNNHDPLAVAYEDFVSDPQPSVERIAQHIGIRHGVMIDTSKTTLTPQADELNRQWRRRFLAERSSKPPEFELLIKGKLHKERRFNRFFAIASRMKNVFGREHF